MELFSSHIKNLNLVNQFKSQLNVYYFNTSLLLLTIYLWSFYYYIYIYISCHMYILPSYWALYHYLKTKQLLININS